MAKPLVSSRYGPEYTPQTVTAIAGCTAAIARLDARICVSSVATAWTRRAAWSGYARALQLQAAEIDEIDVFSWGCGLQAPGRPLRSTTINLFDRFADWREALNAKDTLAWRDALPTAIGEPEGATGHPPLVRALDRVRQHASVDGSAWPWLGLPFALRDLGLSGTPLPCLAGGVKAFRLKRALDDADWLAAIKALTAAADTGLERLAALERLYEEARRAILVEYRPGALPRLMALSHHQPLLSPQSVATTLGLTLAGASKLLERAAATGLLVEITQRRSWRLFLTRDTAVVFGFAAARRGRPRKPPPPLPATRDLAETFAAFDDEMSRIDKLLDRTAAGGDGTRQPVASRRPVQL